MTSRCCAVAATAIADAVLKRVSAEEAMGKARGRLMNQKEGIRLGRPAEPHLDGSISSPVQLRLEKPAEVVQKVNGVMQDTDLKMHR